MRTSGHSRPNAKRSVSYSTEACDRLEAPTHRPPPRSHSLHNPTSSTQALHYYVPARSGFPRPEPRNRTCNYPRPPSGATSSLKYSSRDVRPFYVQPKPPEGYRSLANSAPAMMKDPSPRLRKTRYLEGDNCRKNSYERPSSNPPRW